MRMSLALRFDYGRIIPWVRSRGYGLHAVAGPDAVSIETPVAMRGEDFTTVAHFTVLEGQEIPFVMKWRPSHKPETASRDAGSLLRQTEDYWRAWSSRCAYDGEWR